MSTTVCFVETEFSDEDFFRSALPDQDLRFASDIADTGEAEVLSVFINFRIDADFLAAHPRLRLIASRSGSLDHIDLPACRARGVAVAYVPDYGEASSAEHTFALILALSRRLREVMALSQGSLHHAFSYEAVRGFELSGKTLGIIGMGRVGQRVARLARAFEMRLVAHDPFEMPPTLASELGFEWRSLEALLGEADIITLHARLTPATRHLLNRRMFTLCRPGAILINTARGALIDTAALREALESGQIGGAGLDVLEDERVLRESASHVISAEIVERLRSDTIHQPAPRDSRVETWKRVMLSDSILARTNVVFTPHTAFNSVEAVERLNSATAQNIRAFLAGQPVNLAEPTS